jgi:hypothetical protein
MQNEKMISLTKAENRRKATFSTATEWIVTVRWDVTPKTIENGLEKLGMGRGSSIFVKTCFKFCSNF